MKKMVAEVKDFAKAMAKSNREWDVYVDKEQDKFFIHLNRQHNNINGLKERLEQVEVRTRAVELENKSLAAWINSMLDKLCFCAKTEANAWVSLLCFGI